MKTNCKILIKQKNKHWYDLAEEYGGVTAFEEWDEGKTPRYSKEVGFRFMFDILSVEEQINTSCLIKLFDSSKRLHTPELSGLRVLTFTGNTQSEQVILSESLLDQVFIEDKHKSKVYIYCYLKGDINCFNVADNIWLSEEHLKELNNRIESPFAFVAPSVKLLMSGSILSH